MSETASSEIPKGGRMERGELLRKLKNEKSQEKGIVSISITGL